MLFQDFQQRLIENVRLRLRNGELTERGFARRLGVSQPHIHNVLKGVRILTPRLADLMLGQLGLSALQLAESQEIGVAAAHVWLEALNLISVPLAGGRLGPTEPWPNLRAPTTFIPLSRAELPTLCEPVAVWIATEPGLEWGLNGRTLALLDVSEEARRDLIPGAWYAIRAGDHGLIRQFIQQDRQLFLKALQAEPGKGKRVSSRRRQIDSLIGGRLVWVGEDPRDMDRLSHCGRFLAPAASR
jgi:transcriptional regulator with XRE-family HTH domain